MLMDYCSLVVSSCDKYETAWYPYFELIKRYWPDRPDKIYLITETKTYSHEGLNIVCINPGKKSTWSERLYQCLSQINTKYIIFSLEDFFLLGEVKNHRLERCFEWMEKDANIAVCRLAVSDDQRLERTTQYEDFFIASGEIPYRLDTQFALWNREILISFLDLRENPWEFEGIGTQRIKESGKIFLWSYAENDYCLEDMIIPYRNSLEYGYNIHWGKWLWSNKKWFKQNGIDAVNYKKLGTLSERAVKRRRRYLYNPNPVGVRKAIKKTYQLVDYLERLAQNIRIYGWKQGMEENLRLLTKHTKKLVRSLKRRGER